MPLYISVCQHCTLQAVLAAPPTWGTSLEEERNLPERLALWLRRRHRAMKQRRREGEAIPCRKIA